MLADQHYTDSEDAHLLGDLSSQDRADAEWMFAGDLQSEVDGLRSESEGDGSTSTDSDGAHAQAAADSHWMATADMDEGAGRACRLRAPTPPDEMIRGSIVASSPPKSRSTLQSSASTPTKQRSFLTAPPSRRVVHVVRGGVVGIGGLVRSARSPLLRSSLAAGHAAGGGEAPGEAGATTLAGRRGESSVSAQWPPRRTGRGGLRGVT